MTKTKSDFIESCRTRARAIKERQASMGIIVTLGQAYEVLAAAHGFRNWATMKASQQNSTVHVPQVSNRGEGLSVDGRVFSFWMVRQRSIDASEGGGPTMSMVLKGAYRELSHAFFDGEEYPAIRFREITLVDQEKYRSIADVVLPANLTTIEALDFAKSRLDVASKGNMLSWMPTDHTSVEAFDNVFEGSGPSGRDHPWSGSSEAAVNNIPR
jgi:hypothetical protein